MSDETKQFTMIVQAVPVLTIGPLRAVVNAMMRYCPQCDCLTMQDLDEDGFTCTECGKATIRNDRLELSAGR